MTKTQKIVMIGLIGVTAALLARFVVFKTRFDAWEAGLKRIDSWQQNYKSAHPNATKEEMDAAFDTGITNLKVWQDNYKAQHPNATDAEMDAAFNAQWKQ